MIDLLVRDDLCAVGLQTILETERIPYRRVAEPAQTGSGVLLVAGGELSSADVAALERSTALVIGGGARLGADVFGTHDIRPEHMATDIPLAEPIWPAAVAAIARAHGKHGLKLPAAPTWVTAAVGKGTILARTAAGTVAAARRNGCVWSPLDLGAAFVGMLAERDRPCHEPGGTAGTADGKLRRLTESAYYAAPELLRRIVQRRAYAALEARLERGREHATDYPIDATGWLLIELVKALLRTTAGILVRVARWPAPYRSAASLTHDVEPRRFAYTDGLTRLLDTVASTGHPATLGLVAGPSVRWLTDSLAQRLKNQRVLCHGLEHRGENVHGRERVCSDLRHARTQLEHRLGRPINGYRSPRLDRSPDLAWALDATSFRWDSSFPDVDRENLVHFGAGVSLNIPYRPLLAADDGRLRPSRCLELPLTAPDCVQPLFGGADVATLRQTVEEKAAFVRATGGLYVALVHGGVFGRADADLRSEHLEFVHRTLTHSEVWLAGMNDIADWWERREALRVALREGVLHVTNDGPQEIVGARVIVERDGGESVLAVPALPAGAEITLVVPRSRDLPAA